MGLYANGHKVVPVIVKSGDLSLKDGLYLEEKKFKVRFFSLYEEVEDWDLDEALTKTALPTSPDISDTDPHLTNDGWNWTLQEIKDYINNQDLQSDIFVGAQYSINDKMTHLFITIPYGGRLTVGLYLKSSVAGGMVIDWGDGSTTTSSSTTIMTYSHTYSASGDYEIILNCNSGTIQLGGNSSSYNIFGTTTDSASTHSRANSAILRKMYLGYINTTGTSAQTLYYCIGLRTFVLGTNSGVNTLNTQFFGNCTALSNFSLGRSLTTIGGSCFNVVDSANYFCLPHSLKTIGAQPWLYAYGLRQLSIPASVTSFSSTTMMYCYAVKYVTFPNSLSSIPYGQFFAQGQRRKDAFVGDYKNKIVMNVTENSTVDKKRMGIDKADCSSLTTIGHYAFANSINLEEVVFNTNTTSFGNYAFAGCWALDLEELPSKMTSLGYDTFLYCSSLKKIIVPETLSDYGSATFNSCWALETANIPSKITALKDYTFQQCFSLDEPDLEDTNVTTLGASTYGMCRRFQYFNVPSQITSVSASCLQQCFGLQYVKWSSTSPIRGNTFLQCYGVKTYDFSDCTSVPTLSSGTNGGALQVNSDTVIIVPDSLYSTWIAATNWKNFASYIKKASEVTLV